MNQNVLSITQLNGLIKKTLEKDFLLKSFYVTGTITNLKHHLPTGHFYFSLKDENSSINVTLWASTANKKGLTPYMENGLLVTLKAGVNFYGKTGALSINVQDMIVGDKSPLQLQFEALKKDLTALGYFDESHKQAIPEMSACIGLVTSSSGAVLHDILHVSAQRNPLVTFKLFSVPVQGRGAGADIARGIAAADADPEIELIILGRGGGSMEDLWCFNEREVVEAIYTAKTPTISAVGHETDFTLADYAADARGATPSHAAELAVYPLVLLQEKLREKEAYLHTHIEEIVSRKKRELAAIFNRSLGIPALTFLHKQKVLLQGLKQDISTKANHQVDSKKNSLALLANRLETLNPVQLMVKGYSKVEHNKKALTRVASVRRGDTIEVTLVDGRIDAIVEEVHHGRKS